jgi:hypothetical protein
MGISRNNAKHNSLIIRRTGRPFGGLVDDVKLVNSTLFCESFLDARSKFTLPILLTFLGVEFRNR